jgi:iron complex outermembrane receptor protein
MKKIVLLSAALACVASSNAQMDTAKVHVLENVQVVSTRANKQTPVAFKDLNQQDIRQVNFGKDVPYILSLTPSVTTTSDAGNGIGYTSIRVRGVDPSRVNITANGIPMNDAESNTVFWVNMGDFASSVKSMQLQRGVGTSTNGSGAFGASINMETESIGAKPYLGIDLSAGSYYSHKETLRFGTGLLGGHWGVQGRLSNIGSKGYLYRASTKLNSYLLQGGYFSDNTIVKFITWNGTEQTYHAWNYTSKYEQSLYGRRYNSCGEYKDDNGNTRYYNDQTDNYHQQNYQLLWDQILNQNWNFNVALHYTKGDGYYDEYKVDKDLQGYGLADKEYTSDLTRQKKMDNDFYGAIAAINYNNGSNFHATLGGGWNKYDGDHFGIVKWVKSPAQVFYPGHEYYRNNAKKTDFNVYAKAQWEFLKGLSAFADLQYRHVGYRMQDPEDDAWADKSGTYVIDEKFDFFNPKAGLTYQINSNNRVYASYAISHKEPTRNDYQDNYVRSLKAEKLQDIEAGYKYESRKFTAGLNLYYMYYNHQYVLTGELNDIGEMKASNDNSGRSYRTGIELEAAWQPAEWFRWDANATFSRNINKEWTITTTDGETVSLGNTHTAFSPDAIFNNIFTFKYKGFNASIQSQYIGKQYLTNTDFETMECKDEQGNTTYETLMLKGHFTTNLDLSYNFALKCIGIKDAKVGISLYNIFSAKYDNNGWAAPQIVKDGNSYKAINTWGTRDKEAAGFAPSAPFNCMAHLSINF